MIETPTGLRPPDDPRDFLKIAPELESFVEVDFVPLLNKDSTNIHPGDWTKIANAVYERLDRGFAGFVIAHGTDTMHFSSSALSFAFGPNLSLPIVFTGAQTIPQVPHGDARVNLVRSCKVALADLAEVVISFGEYIFRGCRVQKKDERRFDAFESPGYFPIGYISEEIDLHPTAKSKTRDRPPIEFHPEFEAGVLQVALIPGLEPELLVPAIEHRDCKGIMLQSFGWGNVPDEAPFSFEDVIKHAVRELGKPVLITSQFPAHATLGSAYAPGIKAVKAGAIPTGNMTNAAAAAKFRWSLAQIEKEIQEGKLAKVDKMHELNQRMQRNYVDEMDQ
jgi:L-asparaginase type I